MHSNLINIVFLMIKRVQQLFLNTTFLASLAIGFVLMPNHVVAQPDGKALFEGNCAACHKVEGALVGPELKGISDRREEAWLLKWIKNSQELVKSGDKTAVELFEKYNKIPMPAVSLGNDEIKAILAYIGSESKSTAASPVATAETKDGETKALNTEGAAEVEDANAPWIKRYSTLLMILSIVGLGIIFYSIARTKKIKKELADKLSKDSDLESSYESAFPRYRFTTVRVFYTLFFSLIIFLFYISFWGAEHVGSQKGYAPKQPIAYSHELHAGQYKIACSYCHTGVERGKSATIPSVNICMNCHNSIKTESAEIKKIKSAWDSGKPIEWIRIHNLQDFAYFNHYQHFKIAKIACQKCHGEIQTMKVVSQHSKLTMGWCIDCHRQTKVDSTNGYYQEVHKEKFEKAHGSLTIAQLGGLECSKCHY